MRTLKTILCIATALSVLAFALAIYYTQFYKDVVPPEIRMDADVITVSAADGDEALLRGVTATDNRDGDITGAVLVDGVSQLTGPNAARVRYIVFDAAENAATASRTVVYSDYEAPRVFVLQPLTYNVGDTIALRGRVIARDCLEGNITDRIRISSQDLSNRAAGVYHLTIWVMNKLGDVSTVTVPVIVREDDPAAPVVELKSYLTYLTRGEEFDPKAYFQSYYDSADMIESFRALKLSHIEPLYLIRVCLRDLWMIILAALCGAMITGTVLTLFYPNAVGAKVTLAVHSRVASSSVIQSNSAAANTAKTFSELLNTDLVRRRVAQSAGYPDYDGKLSVKVQKDTNLIDVSLTAPTSKQAYALIQSVCNSYDTLTNYVSKNMIVQKFNTPTIYSVPGSRVSRLICHRLETPV